MVAVRRRKYREIEAEGTLPAAGTAHLVATRKPSASNSLICAIVFCLAKSSRAKGRGSSVYSCRSVIADWRPPRGPGSRFCGAAAASSGVSATATGVKSGAAGAYSALAGSAKHLLSMQHMPVGSIPASRAIEYMCGSASFGISGCRAYTKAPS